MFKALIFRLKVYLCKCINYVLIVTYIYEIYQKILVLYLRYKVKNQKPINIIFFATYSSQWKCQRLYNLLKEDKRFNPIILLTPCRNREENQDYIDMRVYLNTNNIPYVDYNDIKNKNIRKLFSPDILFYTQPYYHIYDKKIDSHSFKDKLIVYIPYFLQTNKLDWGYNLDFHHFAWKLYYNSDIDKKYSIDYSLNKGRNVEIVGYINSDLFKMNKILDVWKSQKTIMKKVIWCPHHSINTDSPLNQSNFLNMAEFMIEIADEYKDKIQFSFKPHPELRRILYLNNDWGRRKTDEYYQKWASRQNTQYDIGDFYDLFLSSDGLINDCSSFSVEYLYTKKPAINCFKDLNFTMDNMSEMGQSALKSQYYGKTKQEIKRFLDDVILGDNDSNINKREEFYNKYLLTPNNNTVTENIYKSLILELI